MVTGFEQETYELTPFERENILPRVVVSWRKKEEEQIITMKQMLIASNQKAAELGWLDKRGKPYKVTGPRMRKVIHAIRAHGIIPNLIASSRGYFKSSDEKKIKNFIKSCTERANSFREVAQAMQTYNFER